jgi:hypothetical protein
LAIDDHMPTEIRVLAGEQGQAAGDDGTAGSEGRAPRAGELLRRGAVYALAGVLRATDVGVAAARGAVRGAKQGADEARGDETPARPA